MSARRAWEWIGVIVMTTGVGRPGALRAQSSADPVRLVRTTDAVALDGRPRETAWNAAPPVPLVQYTPTEGAGTSDSSDIRLLYDDKFLYVGARLFVEDPGSIRPGLFARDQLGTEDHLMVILDSAGDERTGLVFALNPAGGLTDNAIGGDGQNVDKSWNGYWDGATSRDESAWYAEFRIPISTLRFQPGRDGAVMGVIIHRQTAARNEMATYPRLPRSYANGLFRPSIAHKVHLAGIAARSPVYLTPYLLGGANSAAAFDPDASPGGATPPPRRRPASTSNSASPATSPSTSRPTPISLRSRPTTSRST